MTYLIVGLHKNSLARWYGNIPADDVGDATRIARTRAAAQGITLIVAAVIGPNSTVLPEAEDDSAAWWRAA